MYRKLSLEYHKQPLQTFVVNDGNNHMQIVHHLFCQQVFTLSSLSPKLRIVSIIPGMEILHHYVLILITSYHQRKRLFPVRLEKAAK